MPVVSYGSDSPGLFTSIESLLTPPDSQRTARGNPGDSYWQQRVSYTIEASLDEATQTITASARITYRNNSPETLDVLWIAEDETGYGPEALANTSQTLRTTPDGDPLLAAWEVAFDFARTRRKGGVRVTNITDARGRDMAFKSHRGLISLPLTKQLLPGKSMTMVVQWRTRLADVGHTPARGGYEYFADTGSYQFFVGHWYPRVLAFRADRGWLTEAYLGAGEFSSEFGDFDVTLTVPAAHVVAATGELTNGDAVLDKKQQKRLAEARQSTTPLFIITPDEARSNDAPCSDASRTWRFHAENVRDFAWASSSKFVWDAASYRGDGLEPPVLLMSFYPYEASGLWSRYSTALMRHTLSVYERATIPYPYPVMQSVNAYDFPTGVEYPMLGFSGPRPHYDRETARSQYGRGIRDALFDLIIHETGHSFFPMIVGSDERSYAWMDEGLNTFLTHIAALEWEDTAGAVFGSVLEQRFRLALTLEPRAPIVTAVDNMPNWFPTVYYKSAGALILLREEILGREVFDRALKSYAERWAFRHPTPADFFRTIEDASGQNLDWFWRGWFYSKDYFDMGIARVVAFEEPPPLAHDSRQPVEARRPSSVPRQVRLEALTARENRRRAMSFATDNDPKLQDYHYGINAARGTGDLAVPPPATDPWMLDTYRAALDNMPFLYGVTLKNEGGLLLPMTLRLQFANGTHEDRKIPVEVWRQNAVVATVPIFAARPVLSFQLDPANRLPDSDLSNNSFADEVSTTILSPLPPLRDTRGEMGSDGVSVNALGEPAPNP